MPDWKRVVQERIAPLRLQPTAESNLIEELAQHLEDCYRELRSGGASDEEAYRNTVSELDDTYPLQAESGRTQRITETRSGAGRAMPHRTPYALAHFVDVLWRDLRYAVRIMRKSPLFVLFVVLTLGLGIGANTTVFTVINTLILNPLPVPDSSRLAAVGSLKAGSTAKVSAPQPLSYPDLKDYQTRNRVFRSLAGYTSSRPVIWLQGGSSQGMFSELVSANYFSTLGLTPAAGRFFFPDEDATPGAHAVAVINYGTWQSRFGGAADVLGKQLRINHVVLTVVGIAPPRFIGVNGVFGPDLWVPASMAEQLFPTEMQGVFSDRAQDAFSSCRTSQPRCRTGPGSSQHDGNGNRTGPRIPGHQ